MRSADPNTMGFGHNFVGARMPGNLVPPHGGTLKPLILEGAALQEERSRAQSLPRVEVSSREKGDLVMLGIGGFSPLDGFMTHADWQSVCDDYQMADGTFWPIPIPLSVGAQTAGGIHVGGDIALVDPDTDAALATMRVTEKYGIEKTHECSM